MMIVCMPYMNVATQPVASASEDIPPPGRLRFTLTAGKPPFGGPSWTNPPGVFGPPMVQVLLLRLRSAATAYAPFSPKSSAVNGR